MDGDLESKHFEKTILKVGTVTIAGNVLLTLAKVVVGILAKASSLVSDGIHSASDVISTIIVMIGAKLSAKRPDKEHPFGHERMESIASIILAMLLGATAILLAYSGVKNIIVYAKGDLPQKTWFAYIALGFAAASIVVKFAMYIYTIIRANQIKSTALKADAYHHLSDSLSSIGSVLGAVGILVGGYWAILDPVACLVIAAFIFKVAYDIAKEGINQVVDKSAPEEFENQVRETVQQNENVKHINSLKTRQFGNKFYVEIAIAVDETLTVRQGHEIAREIHNAIEKEHEDVKHCMIHVDPSEEVEN